MSGTVTQAQSKAAMVESGIVLDVDISTYTLTATTEFTKKPVTGIVWSTPYQHYANGEGSYFMPEVGSLCWLCFPSDHNRPFVMGWGPAASNDGDYRSKKKDLNPGDLFMGTRDENFLILRRGGVVQIGGGPLSQRMFLPINNTIKDFCENYGLHTLGGDLEWTIQRQTATTDGTRPAQFSVKAREFADDPNPIAQLLIGSHGSGDNRILSLLINASGQSGAAQEVALSFGKDGVVKWTVQKDVLWDITGDHKITVKGNHNLKVTGDITEQGKSVTITGDTTVDIKASGGNVTITGSPLVKMDSLVQAGGTNPVAMAIPLITWLATHFHNIVVPVAGSPVSPPTVPPTPTIASTSCFAK